MRILCVFGAHQYGDATRGASLEASCFIPALREEGHEVSLFDSWIRGRYATLAELNGALLDAVVALRPDLLLSVVRDVELWSETLGAIRARGVRTLSWATDDTWKWRQVSRFILHDYDGMITTHEGALEDYRQHGARHVLLSQWAAPTAAFQAPLPAASCRHQVSFVGIAYGDRRRFVAALVEAGIPVTCFGHQWPAGSVPADDIPRIMRDSVIALNFSKGLYGGPHQIKARVFEVPGAGGFLLTEDAPGLSRWFRIGEEIDVFHDEASLVERVRHYLAQPVLRDQCARRAHERTRREHTYRQRMRAVVAFAQSLPAPHAGPVDLAPAMAHHVRSWWLRALRQLLVGACRALWGKRRSQAYARRIAFELSWRLSGRRSFCAAGWFGRMFP